MNGIGRLPHPLDSPWVWNLVRRYGLPVWFVFTTISQTTRLYGPWFFGFDTRLAVGAAQKWLNGADPWSYGLVGAGGSLYHFAGLPPTILIYASLVPLGLELAGYVGIVASLVVGVLVLRRLRLPMWWLLFPPLNQGIANANPHMLLLGLLVLGGSWAAPLVKVYAFIPMFGEQRWRQIAFGLAAFAVTLVVAPALWLDWLSSLGGTTSRLIEEAYGGWSLTGPAVILGLIPIVVIAWRKDIRTAGWLAVPAAWPASEFFYSTLALPVMTPLLAVLLAVPQNGAPTLAVAAYALQLVWEQRRSPRPRPVRFRVREALDFGRPW